jgi:hypothetical protein
MTHDTEPRAGTAPTPLEAALARLPLEVAPPHDLWPAIEARLEARLEARPARIRGRWTGWPLAAAAAVALVAATALVTAHLVRRDPASTGVVAGVTPSAPGDAAASPDAQPASVLPATPVSAKAFGPGYLVGPAYLAHRRVLARSLEERVAKLPPEGRAQLERSLGELRRATAEINAALELRPGDPLLEELLLNVYQDELAVLASVDQVTATNGAAAPPATDPTRMPL